MKFSNLKNFLVPLLIMAALAVGIFTVAGCGGSAAENTAQLEQQILSVEQAKNQLQANLTALETQLTTQPGNEKLATQVTQLRGEIAKADSWIATGKQMVATAKAAATQPGADPISVAITTAGTVGPVIPGPVGGYVVICSAIASVLYGLYKDLKARNATQREAATQKAAQANGDAFSDLVSRGLVTVKGGAPAAADVIVEDHRLGDNFIDTLAAAPKTP